MSERSSTSRRASQTRSSPPLTATSVARMLARLQWRGSFRRERRLSTNRSAYGFEHSYRSRSDGVERLQVTLIRTGNCNQHDRGLATTADVVHPSVWFSRSGRILKPRPSRLLLLRAFGPGGGEPVRLTGPLIVTTNGKYPQEDRTLPARWAHSQRPVGPLARSCRLHLISRGKLRSKGGACCHEPLAQRVRHTPEKKGGPARAPTARTAECPLWSSQEQPAHLALTF